VRSAHPCRPRRIVAAGRARASEFRQDLDVAHQEGAFVEALAPEPRRHLEVALARVAGPTCGHHVADRVPTTTGQREHAIALQRNAGHPAVRAATPGGSERGPLVVAEIVLDSFHPAFAPTSSSNPAGSAGCHERERMQLVPRLPATSCAPPLRHAPPRELGSLMAAAMAPPKRTAPLDHTGHGCTWTTGQKCTPSPRTTVVPSGAQSMSCSVQGRRSV
jgi:hypothetical protein